jgi:hypothetical protein
MTLSEMIASEGTDSESSNASSDDSEQKREELAQQKKELKEGVKSDLRRSVGAKRPNIEERIR